MFLTNHDGLNNLGRGSPRKHFCQGILKSVFCFLTRRFFLYRYVGKISTAPWRPCVCTNHDGLNHLGRGSLKEYFCKIICMDSKSLNNFQSVSPKDQSCEIWLKLAQWFRRRCCLNIVDRRTDEQMDDDNDGRWLITIAHLEPSALMS